MKLPKPALTHLFVLGLGLFIAQNLQAVCTTLIKGPVAIEVKQCRVIVPETTFATGDSKYSFIKDLPPANRKQFVDRYRGILVNGMVTESLAVRQDMLDVKGALQNESIAGFIPAHSVSCDAIQGKKIEVDLSQACCEGGGESPCLLDTGYVLNNVKVSSAKGSPRAGGAARTPEGQALYAKAKQAIQHRDLKTAGTILEQIRSKGELDLNGKFQLAVIYRELDKCPQALPLLDELNKKFENKEYWTDTESSVRKGSYLYARCLSISGQTSEAVLVLQGFLVEPNRYRKEITDSLSHKDFGRIRSSKSYEKYRKSAEKALKAPVDDDDSSIPL